MGMNLKSSDLDAIFNGASVAVSTAQNICGAVTSGINDIRNVVDDSRRNIPVGSPQYSGYRQPVTYGYGYGDTNNYPGYNGYPSTGYGNNTIGQANMGGYPGFYNPGYGNVVTSGSMFGGPVGGAWG